MVGRHSLPKAIEGGKCEYIRHKRTERQKGKKKEEKYKIFVIFFPQYLSIICSMQYVMQYTV